MSNNSTENIDNKKKSLFDFKFLSKLKNIKNIEIIITVLAIAIVLLIYFSTNSLFTTKSETQINNQNQVEYVGELERKLNVILSEIDGAGKVSVMITIEGTSQYIYAKDSQSTTTKTNDKTETETNDKIVIVQNKPVVEMEILPKIKGVIVVSQGANNINVKLEILKAVQTLLEVSSDNVEIFIGK